MAIKMKIKISTMKKSALFLKSGVYESNYTFLNTSSIVVIIYSLYRIKAIVVLLAQGYSWWAIRLMATSGEGGAGTLNCCNLSDVIYSFIVSPLIYLIVPTIISEILEGHKRRNSIILSIVATILYSVATVSRAVWAFAIVYVLCASILMKGYLKLTKSQKKVMKFVPIIVVILAFAINKITKMRNAEADLFTNAYAYISGCMPLLSIHVEEAISEIRTHGMLTMYGFLHPIFL